MSRNLDTPEEMFLIRVLSVSAAQPEIASMAYRLVNGSTRAHFKPEQVNKMREILKQLINDMNKLESESE